MISEYRHWEETHCYLLNGSERSLLIDTGLGICNIHDEVIKLTDQHVTAVATHIHWDHIGGHKYFPDFYAHGEELDWLSGAFPLSIDTIRNMVIDRCELPENYDVGTYEFVQGTPTVSYTHLAGADYPVFGISAAQHAFQGQREYCHESGDGDGRGFGGDRKRPSGLGYMGSIGTCLL